MPNVFHQTFYLKNTLSLRLRVVVLMFFFPILEKQSANAPQSFSNEKTSDVQTILGLLKEFRNYLWNTTGNACWVMD